MVCLCYPRTAPSVVHAQGQAHPASIRSSPVSAAANITVADQQGQRQMPERPRLQPRRYCAGKSGEGKGKQLLPVGKFRLASSTPAVSRTEKRTIRCATLLPKRRHLTCRRNGTVQPKLPAVSGAASHSSIRLSQAVFFTQFYLALTSAFAILMSLRWMATIAMAVACRGPSFATLRQLWL